MPKFIAPTENVTLGYILEQSEESLDFDVGSDYSQSSLISPELEGFSDIQVPSSVKLPLYTVITVPGNKTLRHCIPVFPFGCSSEHRDVFTYKKGEFVLVMYTSNEGYPVILGAVPIFCKDKVRSGLIPTDESRVIEVGNSRIILHSDSIEVLHGDYRLVLSGSGISVTIPYSTPFQISETEIRLGPLVVDPSGVTISQDTNLSGSSISIASQSYSENSVVSTLVSDSRSETYTSLLRRIRSNNEQVQNSELTFREISILLSDFVGEGITPKITITSESKLDEEGGITIQRSEGFNPENVAKAKTLKEQLDLFLQWAKTHIHETTGAPPKPVPPEFNEDWFSELIKTD